MTTQWSPRVITAWVWLGIVAVFLAVFAALLELAGLAADEDAIPPLTQIVSGNVSAYIVLPVCIAIAAFGAWLVLHFWQTYEDIRRAKRTNEE